MPRFEDFYKDFSLVTEIGLSRPSNNKSLYIIGTGGSIRDMDLPKIIGNNDTMTINRCWFYLKKFYNITPTYNVTLDPNEFYELFKKENLLNNNHSMIKNTIFFMDKGTYTCDIRFGKPGKEEKKQLISSQIKRFGKIGAQIIYFPEDKSYDSRKMMTNQCDFIGGHENKLSMIALPLAFKLGYRKIFLLGTDYNYSTGHWYNLPGTDRMIKFKKNNIIQKMNYEILKKWSFLFKRNGGSIVSLIPNKYTKINNYL
jgi:hypothetical protein